MKVVYVGVNAKYIHTNPAIRILTKLSASLVSSSFLEFTIKDSEDEIIEKLLSEEYEMIGFSCYIWNIEIIKSLTLKLKKKKPSLIVFAGGPEVSYETSTYPFDYILKGDAELVIEDFLKYKKVPLLPKYVNNMDLVPFIGDMYSEDDFKNRFIYVETTRGCPYNCSYCLASIQLDHVIFKQEKRTFEELDYYFKNNVKTIKFLDRSFNVNPKRFIRFLEYLDALETKHTFQFEIAAELLNEEVMDYLMNKVSKNRVRLEIGIQSTLKEANEAVERYDDVEDSLKKIKQLVKSKRVIIHADLIVGLPYEGFERSKKSFNDVFEVFPQELQLGFLKRLKGTKLAKDALKYNYIFDELPPYEIIENKYISNAEIKKMKKVEKALDVYWNKKRLPLTIEYLVTELKLSPYHFFEELGIELAKDKIVSEVKFYEAFYNYALKHNLNIIDLIKEDYLNKNQVRPRRFWGSEKNKYSENKEIVASYNIFLPNSLDNAFISEIENGYLVLVYKPIRKLFKIVGGLLIE